MSPEFRQQFANLTPAETLTVLGWLLDPAQGDPEPELPEDMLEALYDLHKAYRASYDELAAASGKA
jgi:hypothetical protein